MQAHQGRQRTISSIEQVQGAWTDALDKSVARQIAAFRVNFTSRGILEGTCLSSILQSLAKDYYLIPSALALALPEALANENAATSEEALPTSSNPTTASTQADNDEAIPNDFPPSLSGHVELARTPLLSDSWNAS
ncbi:hypothetical protein HYDPIDRAFT_164615 [Hydnomerulius pinastri MD-312]|nr:hypothetical protein HYDPIDRAFT_164615 [Hydnomerulius pinastri MD-312]